jgi:hypothetical protein
MVSSAIVIVSSPRTVVPSSSLGMSPNASPYVMRQKLKGYWKFIAPDAQR